MCKSVELHYGYHFCLEVQFSMVVMCTVTVFYDDFNLKSQHTYHIRPSFPLPFNIITDHLLLPK